MNPLGLPIMVSVVLLGMVALCGLIGLGMLLSGRPARLFLIYTIFPLLSGVAASWIGLVLMISAWSWEPVRVFGIPFPIALYYATIPAGVLSGVLMVRSWDSPRF